MTEAGAAAAAVAAAAAIGTVDFFVGLMGRWDDQGLGMLVVFPAMCVASVLIASMTEGLLDAAGLGWGLLHGLATPFGFVALMRGISQSRVVVVVPVSGLVTILVPVAVDFGGGTRPGPVLWTGLYWDLRRWC